MHPSPASIEPPGIFDGLQPGAILLGAIVDNVATAVVSIALVSLLGPAEAFSEDKEASQAAFDALASESEFLFWSLALGLGCTVFGAFVGARRAGSLHVHHGGWVAVASAVIGLMLMLVPGQGAGMAPPLWYEAIGWALLLPAGLLGGALAGRIHGGDAPGARAR
jgi:hypothetical protein